MNNILTYEYVSECIKKKSNGKCYLISGDIKNSSSPITIKCKCGNIFESTYRKIKDRDNIRCRDCVNKELRQKYGIPFEKVLEIIKSLDCEYIGGDYVNSKSKLTLKCKCGNIFQKDLSHLQRGQNRCNDCGRKALRVNKTKFTLDIAKSILARSNISILNENEYENSSSSIKCKCANGHIFTTKLIYHLYKSNPIICEKCATIKNSGQNNYNYDGGINALNEHFRRFLKDWKLSVFEKYNNRCYLTKSSTDCDVHHLISLSSIVKQCCSELSLPILSDINQYDSKDLEKLKNLVIEKHTSNIGIVLQRKVHNKFHSIYGKKDITIEKFNDFIKKYYPRSKLIPTLM